MSALPAKTTTSQLTPWSEPFCSDRLNALLASGNSPTVGPNTAGELRTFLDAQPSLDMPTQDRIDTMIGKLAIATKERRLSVAENSERLDVYWRALRDLPMIDLARGYDDLIRTKTWMPTPAEVRAAAMVYTKGRSFKASRARYLLMLHERNWSPPIAAEDCADPSELDEIRKGIAQAFPTTHEQGD